MASRATSLLSPLARQLRPRALRAAATFQRPLYPSTSASFIQPIAIRAAHTIPRPPPPEKPSTESLADNAAAQPSEAPASEGERPEVKQAYYQLSFTCVPCGHRSHHNVSKQGYHTGSTLITCPECRNRHIISDHLGIFGDRKITVEDLMREKGQLVKRGSLGEDGDIEFWPDDQATEQK